MMLGTRIIHSHRAFLCTTFQSMWLYGQNGRVSIVDIEDILLFKVVGLFLCPSFEGFEPMPLIKSGEG